MSVRVCGGSPLLRRSSFCCTERRRGLGAPHYRPHRGRRHAVGSLLRTVEASGAGHRAAAHAARGRTTTGMRPPRVWPMRALRWWRSISAAASTPISVALALDVRAAKAFLRERPEVLTTSIGIAGASIGANLARDRCRRRSGRSVDCAALARARLPRAAHRSAR